MKAESAKIAARTDESLSSLRAQLQLLSLDPIGAAWSMLKNPMGLARQVIELAGDVRLLKAEFKDRQPHDKEQDERIDELTRAVRQLAFRVQHDRECGARDRQDLILQWEVALLRLEKGLPRNAMAIPNNRETNECITQ